MSIPVEFRGQCSWNPWTSKEIDGCTFKVQVDEKDCLVIDVVPENPEDRVHFSLRLNSLEAVGLAVWMKNHLLLEEEDHDL